MWYEQGINKARWCTELYFLHLRSAAGKCYKTDSQNQKNKHFLWVKKTGGAGVNKRRVSLCVWMHDYRNTPGSYFLSVELLLPEITGKQSSCLRRNLPLWSFPPFKWIILSWLIFDFDEHIKNNNETNDRKYKWLVTGEMFGWMGELHPFTCWLPRTFSSLTHLSRSHWYRISSLNAPVLPTTLCWMFAMVVASFTISIIPATQRRRPRVRAAGGL